MGENSAIGWTTHTFNIAWGCTEIGPGCDNCYAREFANRYGYKWGPGAPRRYFGDKHWIEPLKWDRRAKEAGETVRVFCSSMADILDNEIEDSYRERLWELIEATPNLTWQLLTKRVGNAKKMLPRRWLRDGLPEYIHFGITVVNQEEADRDIPKLLYIPARVRWLSIEPQLGPIDLTNLPIPQSVIDDSSFAEPFGAYRFNALTNKDDEHFFNVHEKIDWVVVGGESGPLSKVRSFYLEWPRSLLNQCRNFAASFFMKQVGARTFAEPEDGQPLLRIFGHGDAADPELWPSDLRVQEFPT